MLAWIVFTLSIVGGLALLAVVGWRLFGQVRSLMRTLGRASEQIAAASAGLDAVAPPRDET